MSNIRSQIMIIFTVVVVAIIVVFLLAFYFHQKNLIEQYEMGNAQKLSEFVNTVIDERSNQAAMGAYIISKTPQFTDLFAERDREDLYKNLEGMWKGLKGDFNVAQFQFHLSPAVSFLRVHKPQKFGDDLSSFRKTVVEVNSEEKVVRGVEKGKAGFGIRGVVPVFDNGKHIGSVEMGLSLGENFLGFLKKEIGGEWFLYTIKKGVAWNDKNYFGTMDNDKFSVANWL